MRNIKTLVSNILQNNKGVYISQIIILYIVIITCIINLSYNNNNGKSELWVSLLSYSLGCLLPSPKIKNNHMNNGTNSSEASL